MRYLRESVDGATHIAIYRDSPRSRKVLDGYLYPLSVNSRKMINGVMVPLPDALPANFPAGKSKSKFRKVIKDIPLYWCSVSCLTWSAALYCSNVLLLSYPITSLTSHITNHHTDIYSQTYKHIYISSFSSFPFFLLLLYLLCVQPYHRDLPQQNLRSPTHSQPRSAKRAAWR